MNSQFLNAQVLLIFEEMWVCVRNLYLVAPDSISLVSDAEFVGALCAVRAIA